MDAVADGRADGGGERTVVVIEDDAHIADLLDLYLREAGFRVLQAATGERGLELVAQHRLALAVLDIGLPDIDGFEVCRRIRATTSLAGDVPHGARRRDRPSARPGARRRRLRRQAVLATRGRRPRQGDPAARRAAGHRRRPRWCASATTSRSTPPGERSAGAASRWRWPPASSTCSPSSRATRGSPSVGQQLIDRVWGADWYGDDRTVDVHVRQLRKKLGDDLPLATVWGIGYRLG